MKISNVNTSAGTTPRVQPGGLTNNNSGNAGVSGKITNFLKIIPLLFVVLGTCSPVEASATSPKPISRPAPAYPQELRKRGVEGKVSVIFVVRKDGSVGQIEVTHSDDPAFSKAAREALAQWRFEPATKDGKKVNVRSRLTFPFRIGPNKKNFQPTDLGQTNEKIRELWRAQVNDPEAYGEHMQTLARLLEEADQRPPPFKENILILTANTYQRTGRLREAIRDYQRMVDEFPESKYTGQRQNKIRAIEALIVETHTQAGSVPSLEDIVGIWSSDIRSTGGLAGQWTFTGNGEVLFTFGALVDSSYVIEDQEIVVRFKSADADSETGTMRNSFIIHGDTLITNNQSMKRVSRGKSEDLPIVGEWTYPYMEGADAFMRYSSGGTTQLSIPMMKQKGTYKVHGDRLEVAFPGKSINSIPFERIGNNLILWNEQKSEKRQFTLFEY